MDRAMTQKQREFLQRFADQGSGEVVVSRANFGYLGGALQTADALYRRGYLVSVSETSTEAGDDEYSVTYAITPEGRQALAPKQPGRPRKWDDQAQRAGYRHILERQILDGARVMVQKAGMPHATLEELNRSFLQLVDRQR